MSETPVASARRGSIALIAIAAIAFVAMRAPFLSVPLERDEGEYAYIAQRMLEGEVPYRDSFDQKPPGVFAAYGLAFSLLGPSVEGIHLFLYFWSAAAALALHGLVRRVAGPVAAGFAVLVFAVTSADPQVQGYTANTEGWMLLPLVLAARCCVRGWRTGHRLAWLACGLFAALACGFKQVALTDACLFAAAVRGDGILGLPTPGARETALRLALFALGGTLAAAPVLLYFAAHGAFAPFVDAVFVHNLAYAQSRSPAEGIEALRLALARQLPSFAWVWVLAVAGCLLPGSAPARVRRALGAWWLASLAGAAVGLHFRPHYFLQTLPALAALAGIGAAALALRFSPPRRAARGAVLAGLAAAIALLPVVIHHKLLFADSPEAISRQIYGWNPFPESLSIANHIRRTSRPEESVFIVGSEPQILFHARRRSATRYIFFYPLTGDYPDARERQQEVIDEVRAARPRYVVWVDVVTSLLRTPRSESLVFDATSELIANEYEIELVARPDASRTSYEIVHGGEARRWLLAKHALSEDPLPSVAVYRRVR